MSFLGNKKLLRQSAIGTLLITGPTFTGALEVTDNLIEASKPPVWESAAYELHTGFWATQLMEREGLQDDHRRIFDWVRQNVDFVAYAGIRQSAQATATTRRGNSFEQAALLGVLLDEADYDWRFAQADVRLTVDEAERWLGIKGASTIRDVLERSGVETDLYPNDRAPQSIVIHDHTWVQVENDFFPLAASAEDDTSILGNTPNDPNDLWIDLDPTIAYRYTSDAAPLGALTGLKSDEIRTIAEKETGALSQVQPDPSVAIADLPVDALSEYAAEAGERVEQLLRDTGESLDALLQIERPLEKTELEMLPGNLPADVVGKVTFIDPSDDELVLAALQKRRHRLSVHISDGEFSHRWGWIGVPQLSLEPLFLSFRAVDDPQNLPDNRTSGMDGANAVPLMVNNGSTTDEALFFVRPLMSLDGRSLNAFNPPAFAYGKPINITIEVSGPGGTRTHSETMTITAGGSYVISAGNILNENRIAAEVAALASLEGRQELIRETLFLAAQSVSEREEALATPIVRTLNQYASQPTVRGVLAGLEPAVANGQAQGVRLALRSFGADAVLTPANEGVSNQTAAAQTLLNLASDISASAPLNILGGHEGYQTPGRIFSFKFAENSQLYHRYPSGTSIGSVHTDHLPASDFPVVKALEELLPGSAAFLTDPLLLNEQSLESALVPGFAMAARDEQKGGTRLFGYTAEDSALLDGWTPLVADQVTTATMVTNPMAGTMLNPLELVTASDGSDFTIGGELVTLRERVQELTESTLGVSEAMTPAIVATSLLMAPHFEQGENWLSDVPAALSMMHRTAESFVRPKITSFDVDVLFADTERVRPEMRRSSLPIMNTLSHTDPVLGTVNPIDSLSFRAEASRRVDTLVVTFNPQQMVDGCAVTPSLSAVETRINDGVFADLGRLSQCLTTSGIYELRAYGEMNVAGLNSEPSILRVEVDNTSPTVALTAPAEDDIYRRHLLHSRNGQ